MIDLADPYLYKQRKFDFRFFVMLHSTKPLKLAVYKIFRVRVANKEFSLDSLHDFEKHCTVMVYNQVNTSEPIIVTDKEFIAYYEEQEQAPFAPVLQGIYKAVSEMFAHVAPQLGDPISCSHCRAIYGVDVILDSKANPYILECNFSPDISVFAKTRPEFYDDAFEYLFKNVVREDKIHVLSQ